MLCKSCCYAGSGRHVDDEGVPRWRLRCQREAELNTLSTKLADLSKSMLDKVHQCSQKLAAPTAVAHLVAELCQLGQAGSTEENACGLITDLSCDCPNVAVHTRLCTTLQSGDKHQI